MYLAKALAERFRCVRCGGWWALLDEAKLLPLESRLGFVRENTVSRPTGSLARDTRQVERERFDIEKPGALTWDGPWRNRPGVLGAPETRAQKSAKASGPPLRAHDSRRAAGGGEDEELFEDGRQSH